ncbi:hypothetical protein Tco_0158000 [Tanacetum coccineum]
MKDTYCVKKKVKITPHDYSKENYLAAFTPQKKLTPEQIFWSDCLLKMKAKALKEKAKSAKPITSMTVYPPNTPEKLRITPTGLTEGERGFEQTNTCYHTEIIPFFKTSKEHFEGIQTALVNEIKEMKEVFDQMEAEVDQHAVEKKCDEIKRKNLLIDNKNLIAECLSKDVFYTATDYVLIVSRFSDMHDAYIVAQKRIAELEAENSNLTQKIQKDDHDEMIKHFSKLELMYAKTIEKTTSLLAEIENLKAQIKGKMPCVTMPTEKPKVLAPGMYAIDVEPIPLPNRNNREVHLDYLKYLKKSVETLREIELLEYVIGTCPKDFNKRDRKIATAPFIRKMRVTFVEPYETSTHNTQTHVEQQKMKKTNEPEIPSTGVKGATAASGSKPRSNIKKDRTLPAKSNPKTVENHPMNNKSSAKRNNYVDSSISSKRTIINSTSNSVFKTCNKCLISFNHDKCVVKSLKFVKKPPVNKWKPTGKKFTLGEQCPLTTFTKSKVVPVKQPENVSTSDIVITKRFSNTSHKPLTRTPTEIRDPTYQTLHIHLFSNAGPTDHPLVFGLRMLKTYDGESTSYKMSEENLPTPTRSDEQLVPVKARLPYGKSNLLLDLQKFQLDEQWFTLNSDLLCHALEITPVDPANPFVSPPAGEIVTGFVNELGYPEVIHFVSHMHVNNLYKLWRAILSLINQCLTGKTSGNDKPKHPVQQMLWGIVTRTNVDYAKLLWEEFVQGIQTFFSY